jgi:hypothetical protein
LQPCILRGAAGHRTIGLPCGDGELVDLVNVVAAWGGGDKGARGTQ